MSYYEYELYDQDQITNPSLPPYTLVSSPTILRTGRVNASTFSVSVPNSTVGSLKSYFGRVRAVDTSGNQGSWTSITKTDSNTPLIDEQYIVSLTADRIKAGEIESASIVLGGANPANTIIKSKTYDTSSGAQGWFIRGDGYFSLGGPNGITYNNSTITIGSNVQVQANLAADSISVGSGVNQLNINDAINGNAGGMTLGNAAYNYWYADGKFRLGDANNYVIWNGSSLSIKGAITADSGTFQGRLQAGDIYIPNTTSPVFSVTSAGLVTAADGYIAGIRMNANRLYSGTGSWANANTAFYLDNSGYFSLKDKLYWNPVTNSLNIQGSISGSSITGSTLSVTDGTDGILITSNGYIRGTGGQGVRIQNSDGSTGSTKFFKNVIITDQIGCNNISITYNGIQEVNIDPSGTGFDVDITGGGIRVASGHTIRASTSFRTTGSSTTARLSQGDSPGDDVMARPSSLRHLKENIQDINSALKKLLLLRPRKYNFKVDAFSDIDPLTGENWTEEARQFAKLDHKYGFIVEEVFESNPDLISYTFEHEKGSTPNYLDFSKWKPSMWEDIDVLVLCVKAIQELSAKVDEIESKLI